MYFLYSLVYLFSVIILFLPQYFRRPPSLRSRWLRDKLGLCAFKSNVRRPIWVHAVSVGEVSAAVPFLNRLKSEYPETPTILSVITDTGLKVAMDKAPAGTEVVYIPFDLGFILNRCIRRIRPALFIVVETEIWPNIFRAMATSGAHVIMLNGRLSEKSAAGYRRIMFFMKKVLGCVDVFSMQSAADADRIEAVGADRARIRVSGNFKFDMQSMAKAPSWAESLGGPLIVAGSTHDKEEELVLEAFRDNLAHFGSLKLILAPRHPERFSEVLDLLSASGISFVRRSEITDASAVGNRNISVVLLDSIGELSSVYGASDIAIIGKSFLGHGGQNPLEPAFWGKPVICGPNMENFPFIQEFIDEGAAFQVEPGSLSKMIRSLLVDPDKGRMAGQKARRIYERNSGAVERSIDIVRPYLDK